jgi:ribokinase
MRRFGSEVVVIGCGGGGAVLAVRQDDFVGRFPAVTVRPVVNTIGAGDALFSAFLHHYARTRNPYTALQLAMVFAAWKIGATGAAEGFLTEAELARLTAKHGPPVKTD